MKKAYILISATVCILLLAGCTKIPDAQTVLEELPIDSSMIQEDLSIDDLSNMNGGDVEIIRDPLTNIPRQINGIFSSQLILTPNDAVLALMSVRSVMHISGQSFSLIDIEDRTDLRVFTLEQLYCGIPVENGLFRVIATNDGIPISVQGTYQQGIELDIVPKISEEKSREMVVLSIGTKIESISLVIFTMDDNTIHLSWKYNVTSTDVLKNKITYIDATDGYILSEIATSIE
ncbi:MAG: hypothetical protein HDT47_01490 [Ruminococcaceae bacterium]|nr:hypothetical protein [Oscillospiraceae bacterium]